MQKHIKIKHAVVTAFSKNLLKLVSYRYRPRAVIFKKKTNFILSVSCNNEKDLTIF